MTAEKNTLPALRVVSMNKAFNGGEAGIEVIRNLDFTLEHGRFEAIMGPSGSGKSTFLHLVAGLLQPDSGTIEIDGTSVTGMTDSEMTVFRRRKIGLIFQDFNLIPTLSAEENIALPLLLDRNVPAPGKMEELLKVLNLTSRRKHPPAKLSGGEKQRVAIARALASSPAVVLADEPTGNLDSPAAHDFCELLKRINRETSCTILMVTHDPVVAASAQCVHLLRDGRFAGHFDTEDSPALVSERYLAAMK